MFTLTTGINMNYLDPKLQEQNTKFLSDINISFASFPGKGQ